MENNKLLTIEEARTILRVGRNTIYNLVQKEGFPSVRVGKQIRIPQNAMFSWIDKQISANVN